MKKKENPIDLTRYEKEVSDRMQKVMDRTKKMLGLQIERMRIYQGVSQAELANRSGMAATTIARLEKGESNNLEAYSLAFDVLGMVITGVLK